MKKISQLIREIIPVIIGILIAIVINNWNEDRKNQKYLNQIFSSMKEELKESKTDIMKAIPKQKRLLDNLGKYSNDEKISLFEIVKKSEGVALSTIKINSWKALASSKIELIDHDRLSMLSDLDEGKEELDIKNEKIFDFLLDNANETNKGKKEVFQLLIQDIIWTEERLQKEVEELIKK